MEAIFVYNTAMRDQMLPRKPLPHPELEEQRKAPLKKVMPGAEADGGGREEAGEVAFRRDVGCSVLLTRAGYDVARET